jgi:hypothetical protein
MWQAVCVVGRKIAKVGSNGGSVCTNKISNCLPVIVLQSTSEIRTNPYFFKLHAL